MQKNERNADRSRLIWSATLLTKAGPIKARIRDLSRAGAKITVESPVPADTEVVLQTRQLFATAKVVWSNKRDAGIEFHHDQPVAEPRVAIE